MVTIHNNGSVKDFGAVCLLMRRANNRNRQTRSEGKVAYVERKNCRA